MVESLREREVLYKLIISQLRYDGLDMVAANLAKCVGLETTPLSPSSRLLGLVKLGVQEEKNGIVPDMNIAPGLAPPVPPARGLDMEYETEESTIAEKHTVDSASGDPVVSEDNTEVQNPEIPADLPRNDDFLGNAVTVGSNDQGEPALKVLAVNVDCEEEVDLNAQPTMIACKGEVATELVVQNSQNQEGQEVQESVNATAVISNEQAMASDLTPVLGQETIVVMNAGEAMDTKDENIGTNSEEIEPTLSRIVDFDPRNKGKLTNLSVRYSVEYVAEAFKPYKEQLRFVNFRDLVSAEVVKFGINQCIFSKAVLQRSQGYLSDLLNHQSAIMSMEYPSRMFMNFLKIKNFLELSEEERRCQYMESFKEWQEENQGVEKASTPKIARRKKRTSLSKNMKEHLILFFKDKATMPENEELMQISAKIGLEISTIKNFFRNYKARSRVIKSYDTQ